MRPLQQDPAKVALNEAIRVLERKDRAAAVACLARHGAINTPALRPDQYQAVTEEAQALAAKIP